MAAPTVFISDRSIFILLTLLFCCFRSGFSSHDRFFIFNSEDVLNVVSSSCLVALPVSVRDPEVLHLFSTLLTVSYKDEPQVTLGNVDTSSFLWPNGNVLETEDNLNSLSSDFNNPPVLLLFKRVMKDRTCLLIPNNIILPKVLSYKLRSEAEFNIEYIIQFINFYCETFRQKDGTLSYQGLHRIDILQNVFSPLKVKVRDSTRSMREDLRNYENALTCEDPGKFFIQTYSVNKYHNQYCVRKSNDSSRLGITHMKSTHFKTQYCDRISVPSTQDFLYDYVFKSKPVIIEGATKDWPALKKWTNHYLREMYGDKIIHIKITPSGEYEGVENVDMWENKLKIKIPQEVLKKLPYPDLVVVRPATMEVKFSKFLDIVEDVAMKKITNMSAYLEYSSVKDYFPELREDFDEMSFFKDILELRHINMWLSDGKTLGKLHFDPFDNFMCQISGEKEFILYDPHQNERLYEAHIQEAILSYNETINSFSRQKLLDSTSMVMSPVDLEKPNVQRFPRFQEAVPMSCKIRSGDVLYTPAFWWHEVRSSPNITERRNLAINFWYEPFLQKEFPCAECRLDVNPRYFHLL